MDNIKNEINNKKYDEYIYIDSKNIVANFNEQYKKFQDYESELRKNLKNDMEELNKKIKDLRKKEIKYEIKINVQEDNITDIANIEYLIIKNFIFDENMKYKRVFSIPEFTSNQTQVDDEVEIETFETDIKNAVKNYEKVTGTEVEKKYQHYFMISKLLNRKLKNFKNIYRFEEEYYTSEKKNDDENKGRIDCVFAKIDENSKSCYNTEIYLIELKVDENVIDGTNGINKHLIDIGKINFNEFKERLEARINYRRKQVLGEDIADIKINPNKFHFWTIIAISNKKHAENVAEKLIKLTDKEKVKQDNLLPKESKVIDEQIEQTKIDQLKKETEVDVRFLFDKNSSDGENYDLSETYLFEQPLPFKDMTKEKFMKMWKENKII